jgi:hypothetical protein
MKIGYQRHLFLRPLAAKSKIIEQVAQINGGRLLACLNGKTPVPPNLTHGFIVCGIHGLKCWQFSSIAKRVWGWIRSSG